MFDPVICPACGESFSDNPAEGKCTKCGTMIPAAAPNSAPTTRTPLPESPPARHGGGVPPVVKVLLLVGFVVAATWVTISVTKDWGRGQHQSFVTEYLDKARDLARKDTLEIVAASGGRAEGVAGAGHWLMESHAAEVNEKLAGWFSSL